MQSPRARLFIEVSKIEKTFIGRKMKPGLKIPFEVLTPDGQGLLKFVSVAFYLGVKMFFVDFYGSRSTLASTLRAILFDLGITHDVPIDARVWEYVKNEHFGNRMNCLMTFFELRQLIAHFHVVAASINETGFWIDPASVTLLSERTPAEDLADRVLFHREVIGDLRMDSQSGRLSLELTGMTNTTLKGSSVQFSKHCLMLIMDTSMVLRNLSYLVDVVRKLNSAHCNALFNCSLHIPWLVICEIEAFAKLTCMNNGFHPISSLAKMALNQLITLIGRSEVTLESPLEFEESLKMYNTIKKRSVTGNLLFSCLRTVRGSLFPEGHHGRFVLFLTDDWELLAEAAIHGIACCDSSTLPRDHEDILHIANRAFKLLHRAKGVLGLKGFTTNSTRSPEFDAALLNQSSEDNQTKTPVVHKVEQEKSVDKPVQSVNESTESIRGSDVGYWRNILTAGKTIMVIYFGPVFQYFLQSQHPADWFLALEGSNSWSFPKLVTMLESYNMLPSCVQKTIKALKTILRRLDEDGSIISDLVLKFHQICYQLVKAFVFVFGVPIPLCITVPKGYQYVDLENVRKMFMEALCKFSMSSAFIEGVLSSDPRSWNQYWMNPFYTTVQTNFFEKVFLLNMPQQSFIQVEFPSFLDPQLSTARSTN